MHFVIFFVCAIIPRLCRKVMPKIFVCMNVIHFHSTALSDMTLYMIFLTIGVGETFPAQGVGLGFLPCMSPDVRFQVARPGERLFTRRAGVRLVSCVGLYMSLQVSR